MKIKNSSKKRFAIFRLSAIIFALLSLIGLYIGGTKQTYADSISLSEADMKTYAENIFSKVFYNNIKRCYSEAITTNEIPEETKDFGKNKLIKDVKVDLYYPEIVSETLQKLTCDNLLTNQNFQDYKENAGFYQKEKYSGNEIEKCFAVKAKFNDISNASKYYFSDNYCVATENNLIKISKLELKKTDSSEEPKLEIISDFSTNRNLPYKDSDNIVFYISSFKAGGKTYGTNVSGAVTLGTDPLDYDAFKEAFKKLIADSKEYGDDKNIFSEVIMEDKSTSDANTILYQKLGGNTGATQFADTFIKIVNETQSSYSFNNVDKEFTEAEKYLIYWDYLKNHYKFSERDASLGCTDGVTWLNEKYIFVDDVCITLDNLDKTEESVYVPENQQKKEDGIIYNWNSRTENASNILEAIKKIDIKTAFSEKPTSNINGGSGDNNSESDICYSAGGALSWILCPIINAARSAIDVIYNTLEDWIRINSGIVEKLGSTDDSGDNSLFKAWSTFRNIANIAFVILFMAIIFSQLTGYGIDNYGVKRMLPKLIITAILVNLSYIICGLLVDISNIVGNSVKGLFEGMAVNKGILGDTSINAPSALVKAILGVGVGVGAIGVFVLSGANFLPIVLFVITMLIGALTILIILGMRQALVIVLIMASPLAMVCMILPNTEGIYKKWKDAFKGMLIVYPIIGAVIGASYFAASIIATTENGGITAIIAGILMIAPYFMIPSLTRKSLDAIGSIGSRISSFGQRGSGRAQNGVRSSNLGKSMQQNADLRRAKRVEKRLQNQYNRRGKLSDKKLEKLRSAQDTILADSKRQYENSLRTGGYLSAMGTKQELTADAEAKAIKRLNNPLMKEAEMQSLEEEQRLKERKARIALAMNTYKDKGLEPLQKEWNKAFDRGDSGNLDVLTDVITQRFGSAGISRMSEKIDTVEGVANNTNAQKSLKTLQGVLNDNRDFAGLMRSKAPDAYQMIADAGRRWDKDKGKEGEMVYEDLKWFTKHNETATAAKDWATASSATLKRAIREGALSQDMITELLTSDDPAIKSGLQSEEKKRKILEGALENTLYITRDRGAAQSSQPSSSTPTQAQPAQTQQTSQPQQSQQPTPTQTQQTSQPEPTQAQPQPAPQQASQPQQQQKTDYTERLKEEIIQRNMNGEFSDETGEELLKMVDGSNNQNPNNS